MSHTIADFDPEEWDGLAGPDVFASQGWLRTVEETLAFPARHRFFFRNDSRGLVAAAACHLQESGDPFFTVDEYLFGRGAGLARLLGAALSPVLVCGPRIGWGEPVRVRADVLPGGGASLVAGLLDEAEHEARRHGWSFCVRCPDEPDGLVSKVLAARGYLRVLEMPGTVLDLPWDSFDGYRSHLRRIHPGAEEAVRNERNRARRTGLRIERVEDPSREGEALHRILDGHYRRLNGRPFVFRPAFLERLAHRLHDRVVVLAARRGAETTGVIVGLRGDRRLFLQWAGIAPGSARDGVTYFNLGFDEPIRLGIESGWSELHFGRLHYDLKVRRGARLIDAPLYVRGRSAAHEALLRPLFRRRSRWVRRMTESYTPPAGEGPPAP